MLKLIIMALLVKTVLGIYDEDYEDPIIDMLLNGESGVTNQPGKKSDDKPDAGGIWKCGNCTELGEAQLTHTEVNSVDEDVDSVEYKADIQLCLTLDNMRCVTVTADSPGAVYRVQGTCDGPTVTLSLSPSHNFTVLAYN